jgi:hypothetical protein
MMLRYAPALAALLYPLMLLTLHQSGQQFLHAPDTAGRLGAGLLLGVAVALVYGVPTLSLAAILKSGRDVLARRLAHLAFAAPPLFVLIGVLFYMLELPKGDYVAWGLDGLASWDLRHSPRPGRRHPPRRRGSEPRTDFQPLRLSRSSWFGTSPIT